MNLVLMIVMGIPMTTMTQYQVVRSNPLETLTNYLTTEKINGCEGDIVNLTCHSGNKISIQSVFYGSYRGNKSPCVNNIYSNKTESDTIRQCHVQAALGVLQNYCQGKDHCSVPVSSTVLGAQPSGCSGQPQTSYHLEVSYQCRPSRFRSRTMCRDDSDIISCQDHKQGLIILSAQFASVEDNYFYCPNSGSVVSPDNNSSVVMGECVRTSVSDNIRQLCHKETNCALKASPVQLNAPVCEKLNVFLKVIYACVELENILPLDLDELNISNLQETTTYLTAETGFTTTIKYPGTTINNADVNKDELEIKKKVKEKDHSESEEILEVGKMTDKKMIYSSAELKFISDPDHKIFNEYGDIPEMGRETSGLTISENSSTDSLLSNFEDPQLLTVLITSVSGVVSLLGMALIFSLICRKRVEGGGVKTSCAGDRVTKTGPVSGHHGHNMVNLDSVSLDSGQDNPETIYKQQSSSSDLQKNVTLSTFQSTEISMLLPSSSSESSGSCSGSSQFLQDIKTLDEKYSLVSSTPSATTNGLDKKIGRFKTFSESTLLESISETDSELQRMSGEYNCNFRLKNRLSSLAGSTTFSMDTERLEREHSFEHYSHNNQDPAAPGGSLSACDCNNCQNNQNLTFII